MSVTKKIINLPVNYQTSNSNETPAAQVHYHGGRAWYTWFAYEIDLEPGESTAQNFYVGYRDSGGVLHAFKILDMEQGGRTYYFGVLRAYAANNTIYVKYAHQDMSFSDRKLRVFSVDISTDTPTLNPGYIDITNGTGGFPTGEGDIKADASHIYVLCAGNITTYYVLNFDFSVVSSTALSALNTTSFAGNMKPRIAINSTKTYFIWSNTVSGKSQVFTGISNLDGTSFTSTQRTTDGASYYTGGSRMGLSIDVDSTRVYYAWADPRNNTSGANETQLRFSSSNLTGGSYAEIGTYVAVSGALRNFEAIISSSNRYFCYVSTTNGLRYQSINSMGLTGFTGSDLSYFGVLQQATGTVATYVTTSIAVGGGKIYSFSTGYDGYEQRTLHGTTWTIGVSSGAPDRYQMIPNNTDVFTALQDMQVSGDRAYFTGRRAGWYTPSSTVYLGMVDRDGTNYNYLVIDTDNADELQLVVVGATVHLLWLAGNSGSGNSKIKYTTWTATDGLAFPKTFSFTDNVRDITNFYIESGVVHFICMRTTLVDTPGHYNVYKMTFNTDGTGFTATLVSTDVGSKYFFNRFARRGGIDYFMWTRESDNTLFITKVNGTSFTETAFAGSWIPYFGADIVVDDNKVYLLWQDYNDYNPVPHFAYVNKDMTGFTYFGTFYADDHVLSYDSTTYRMKLYGNKLYFMLSKNDYSSNPDVTRMIFGVSNLDGSGFTEDDSFGFSNDDSYMWELAMDIDAATGERFYVWTITGSPRPQRGLMFGYSAIATGPSMLIAAISGRPIKMIRIPVSLTVTEISAPTENVVLKVTVHEGRVYTLFCPYYNGQLYILSTNLDGSDPISEVITGDNDSAPRPCGIKASGSKLYFSWTSSGASPSTSDYLGFGSCSLDLSDFEYGKTFSGAVGSGKSFNFSAAFHDSFVSNFAIEDGQAHMFVTVHGSSSSYVYHYERPLAMSGGSAAWTLVATHSGSVKWLHNMVRSNGINYCTYQVDDKPTVARYDGTLAHAVVFSGTYEDLNEWSDIVVDDANNKLYLFYSWYGGTNDPPVYASCNADDLSGFSSFLLKPDNDFWMDSPQQLFMYGGKLYYVYVYMDYSAADDRSSQIIIGRSNLDGSEYKDLEVSTNPANEWTYAMHACMDETGTFYAVWERYGSVYSYYLGKY